MLTIETIRHRLWEADRRKVALALGAVGGVAAGVIGLLLAVIGPVYTVALLAGIALGVWMLTDLNGALYVMIAIIMLLPYGTLPFKIGLTPTFLDLAMGAALLVYLFQWMTGRRRRLTITPVHPAIVAFAIFACFSFVVGLQHAMFRSSDIRHFAELMLSIGFALIIVDVARDEETLRKLALVILVTGTMAAALAIFLYALPDATAERLLVSLSRIGYPDGGVIRYIEDNPALPERAIGTSVDPNSLGGMLVMVGSLAAPQLFARRPLLGRRWVAWVALGTLGVALLLTFSRGSMLAFAGAMAFIALLRYRRLLFVLVILGLLLMMLPPAQDFVAHLIEGFRAEDKATQMRFGEYKDALRLIGRYPIFGVGFTGTPDVDLYLGVSSVYLTILCNMGFAGLAVFLIAMAALFGYGLANAGRVRLHEGVEAIWLGFYAGLVGVGIVGMFDHYFFNLEFHHAETLFWLYVGLALASTRVAVRGGEP